MVRSVSVKTNDYMQVIYVCYLVRSVIGLHNLINNKIHTKEIEVENQRKEKGKRRRIEKEKGRRS